MAERIKRKFYIWAFSFVVAIFAIIGAIGVVISSTKADEFATGGLDVSVGYGDPTADTKVVQSFVIEDTNFIGDSTFIYVVSGEEVNVSNCTFTRKTGTVSSDVIRVEGGVLNLSDSTITLSSEDTSGREYSYSDGVRVGYGQANITDTIIEKMNHGVYGATLYEVNTSSYLAGNVDIQGNTEIKNNNYGIFASGEDGNTNSDIVVSGNVLVANNNVAIYSDMYSCVTFDSDFSGLIAENDEVCIFYSWGALIVNSGTIGSGAYTNGDGETTNYSGNTIIYEDDSEYNVGNSISLTDVNVVGNSGGISSASSVFIDIKGSTTFSANTADKLIDISDGRVTIDGSASITGTGTYGIYNSGATTVEVKGNAVISGFVSPVYMTDGTLSVSGSPTISGTGEACNTSDTDVTITGGTIATTATESHALSIAMTYSNTISNATLSGGLYVGAGSVSVAGSSIGNKFSIDWADVSLTDTSVTCDVEFISSASDMPGSLAVYGSSTLKTITARENAYGGITLGTSERAFTGTVDSVDFSAYYYTQVNVAVNSGTLKSFNSALGSSISVRGGNVESVYVESAGLTITGGTVGSIGGAYGNVSQSGGLVSGRVYLLTGMVYTMTGGRIAGINTDQNGAVFVNSQSTFDMSGGTISGNTALNGGALYVDGESIANIYGSANIVGNTATQDGGAIFVASGELHIGKADSALTGAITGNTAASGGGIYMAGGELHTATATIGGSATVDSVAYTQNTASEFGGGICFGGGSIVASDNTTFTVGMNAATNEGPGVYVNTNGIRLGSSFVASDSAVCVDNSYNLDVESAKISNLSVISAATAEISGVAEIGYLFIGGSSVSVLGSAEVEYVQSDSSGLTISETASVTSMDIMLYSDVLVRGSARVTTANIEGYITAFEESTISTINLSVGGEAVVGLEENPYTGTITNLLSEINYDAIDSEGIEPGEISISSGNITKVTSMANTLTMTGGNVGTLEYYDGATVNISGGAVTNKIYSSCSGYGEMVCNISGGTIADMELNGAGPYNSCNVSGGTLNGRVDLVSTQLGITGGTINSGIFVTGIDFYTAVTVTDTDIVEGIVLQDEWSEVYLYGSSDVGEIGCQYGGTINLGTASNAYNGTVGYIYEIYEGDLDYQPNFSTTNVCGGTVTRWKSNCGALNIYDGTVTTAETDYTDFNAQTYYVSKITIEDGTINDVTLMQDHELHIKGGTVASIVDVSTYGIVYMTGGTITTSCVASSIHVSGGTVNTDIEAPEYGMSVEISGGTVNGSIVGDHLGSWTISGGTINGSVINANMLTMSGGTINVPTGSYGLNNCQFVTISGTAKILGTNNSGIGVYMGDSSISTTMTSGEISGLSQGVYLNATDSQFTMSGGLITNNSLTGNNANGAGIFAKAGTTVEISGGTISANTAVGNGGGIFVNGSSSLRSSLTISGSAIISGNTATNSAGIFMNDYTDLTIAGGEICSNICTDTTSGTGGGIGVSSTSYTCTFTMSGGSVYSNTSVGGAVHLYQVGTVNITGGSIYENSCGACGILFRNPYSCTITGLTVRDNTVIKAQVFVEYYKTTTMTQESVVHIYGSETNPTVISEEEERQDNMLCVNVANDTTYGETLTINGCVTIDKPGYYYSAVNVDGVDNVTIGSQNGANDVSFVGGDSGLHVNNCKTVNFYSGIIYADCEGELSGSLYLSNIETFNMYGGEIQSRSSFSRGVRVDNFSRFNMYGGEIKNNDGGGIIINDGSEANIYGGTITENGSDSVLGGGILLKDGGILNLPGTVESNPHITNNKASMGGGIYVEGGDYCGYFDASYANIEGNSAVTNGGGIWLPVSSMRDATIYSGCYLNEVTIAGNTAENGAGIYSEGSTVGLYATFVQDNVASGYGGGLYLCHPAPAGSSVDEWSHGIRGGSVISGNSSGNKGGGILVYGGEQQRTTTSLTVENTTFSNNTTSADGGGICAWHGANVFINSGVTFSGNTAATGGGVAVVDSTSSSGGLWKTRVEITGTKSSPVNINANTATNGGGVYLWNGTLKLANYVYVASNTASSNGGGAYIVKYGSLWVSTATSSASFTTNDVRISSNTAQNGGGVAVAENGKLYIGGLGYIVSNRATNDGGGVWTDSSGATISDSGTIQTAGYIGYYSGAATPNYQGNTAGNKGGGVYCAYGKLNAPCIRIEANEAIYGGGIEALSPTALSVSAVAYNTAYVAGGGIDFNGAMDYALNSGYLTENRVSTKTRYTDSSVANFVNSSGDVDNTTNKWGGAIAVHTGFNLTIEDVNIWKNYIEGTNTSVEYRGGAIGIVAGTVTYSNSRSSTASTSNYNGIVSNYVTTGTSGAEAIGGAVYICDGGTFVLNSGDLQSNYCVTTGQSAGGSVFIEQDCLMNVYGGNFLNTYVDSSHSRYIGQTTQAQIGGAIACLGAVRFMSNPTSGGYVYGSASYGGAIAYLGTTTSGDDCRITGRWTIGGTATKGAAIITGNTIKMNSTSSAQDAMPTIEGDICIAYAKVTYIVTVGQTYGSMILANLPTSAITITFLDVTYNQMTKVYSFANPSTSSGIYSKYLGKSTPIITVTAATVTPSSTTLSSYFVNGTNSSYVFSSTSGSSKFYVSITQA